MKGAKKAEAKAAKKAAPATKTKKEGGGGGKAKKKVGLTNIYLYTPLVLVIIGSHSRILNVVVSSLILFYLLCIAEVVQGKSKGQVEQPYSL